MRFLLLVSLLVSTTTTEGNGRFWKGLFATKRTRSDGHNRVDTVRRGGSDAPNGATWSSSSALGGRRKDASSNNNSTMIEEYVAAVEERDARDRLDSHDAAKEPKDDWEDKHETSSGEASAVDKEDSSGSSPSPREASRDDEATVGVKSHKKSGSVGDADSDDDDDEDDDSDSDESDWEDFEEDLDNMISGSAPTQLEVEVEFVEDEEHDTKLSNDDHDNAFPKAVNAGGGVGVILGQPRTPRRSNSRGRTGVTTTTVSHSPVKEQEMLQAWLPHVYFPPSKGALDYLSENARMIDGASKSRLDRRTLYACLLLEWIHANATYRKFLEKATSQALQAALSLATQPQWRKCSSQRLCGIRLYDNDATERGCTLAMQETIVMALVRE